jgi:hypothetical protein
MTLHAHHSTDLYINAYQSELRAELSDAHSGRTAGSGIRRSIARSLVRIGAWMLPEKPGLIDGRILVLDVEHPAQPHQRAA